MLRRVMRRAIVQGRRIGIEPGFLPRFADRRARAHGRRLPRAARARGHDPDVARAPRRRPSAARSSRACGCSTTWSCARRTAGEEGIGADQAFLLHDTYGFPFDLTLELAAEQGLGVDEQGFEELMDEQRAARARSAGTRRRRQRPRADGRRSPRRARSTTFTGYETTEQATAVGGARAARTAACWPSSSSRPFYATGGGQVARRRPDRVRGRRLRRARGRRGAGSATTRRSCSSRSRASCARASGSSRAWTPRAG